MKKYILILIIPITLLLACKEDGPFINFEENQDTLIDTTYISATPIQAQNKNVLFEEFSGVRCSNCPSGNQTTHQIYIDKGARFIPVTCHSDFLGYPYDGNQDLRTADANEIANTLGPVGQKPSAFINRQIINGSRLQGSLGTWAPEVDAVLNESSFCNLLLEIVDADATERTVRYRITVEYSALSPAHNLGFYLTESEIEAEQLNGTTHIHDYVHEFVLRKSITPIIGEALGDAIPQNTVIIKEFQIDLDDYDANQIWNINHMHLVAFIRTDNQEIETATMVDIN